MASGRKRRMQQCKRTQKKNANPASFLKDNLQCYTLHLKYFRHMATCFVILKDKGRMQQCTLVDAKDSVLVGMSVHINKFKHQNCSRQKYLWEQFSQLHFKIFCLLLENHPKIILQYATKHDIMTKGIYFNRVKRGGKNGNEFWIYAGADGQAVFYQL